MDKLCIIGGIPLKGEISISGAKNASLPLMVASLLSDKPLTLENLPHVEDILSMANLLATLGVKLTMEGCGTSQNAQGKVITFDASTLSSRKAPYDLVRKMRASILVLGPLLARTGYAKVSLPGGCAIGARPVNLHLKAMEKLGAEIEIEQGYVIAKAPKGLRGANIEFPVVTVGGTENALMAAVLAKGTTCLTNAAREPEIIDLANCLVSMGAKIQGIGTTKLVVEGVETLFPATHRVIPDRIETGTYMIAGAITGGSITLRNARLDTLPAFVKKLREAGVILIEEEGKIHVSVEEEGLRGVDITTAPHPGFPTDLQAQTMALLCTAKGKSSIIEAIFENRFMHVPELIRMGANISLNGNTASIKGVNRLHSAEVMATDLRASVSLVLAALVADGKTTVNRIYHLDRGYEYVEAKLRSLGAQIERLKDA